MVIEEDPINPGRLAQLRRLGGPPLVRKLIVLFLEGVRSRIAAARGGVGEGRWKVVEDAAHSVKSSAGNIGATGLQALAGRIESLAASLDTAPLPGLVAELDSVFARVRVRLLEEERGLSA
jgi:HPt (histidine-containing phosphotransfer) domain-containing protein